jgi:hypothetical protein
LAGLSWALPLLPAGSTRTRSARHARPRLACYMHTQEVLRLTSTTINSQPSRELRSTESWRLVKTDLHDIRTKHLSNTHTHTPTHTHTQARECAVGRGLDAQTVRPNLSFLLTEYRVPQFPCDGCSPGHASRPQAKDPFVGWSYSHFAQ